MRIEHSNFKKVLIIELVDIQVGKTPARSDTSNFGGSHTWVSISDLKGTKYVSKSKENLSDKGLQVSKIKLVPKGTVLFSFKLSIGKVSITDKDLYTNEAIAAFLIKDASKLDLDYFYYVMSNFDFADEGSRAVMGKTLNKAKLQKLKIPLPPLDTQQHIVQVLDKAQALKANLQAQLEDYEKMGESLFLEMFGDPVVNPMGWEKVKLKACNSKIGSGSTPRGGKEAYKREGISLIRSMNVYDHYFKYKNLAFIDDSQAEKLKNVIVEEGDVLFNITGASVCRCTIVPNDVLPARVNQHVAILRPQKEKLISLFLSYLLVSRNCKNELLGISRDGGATREAITKESLEQFEIPLPPIELQNQFAKTIQNLKAQKQAIQVQLEEAEALFQKLLQMAFKGELVAAS